MLSHQSLPPFFVSSDITIQLFDTKKQPAKIHELIDFEIFRPLLEEARPDKPQPKHKVFDLFNELLATQGFAAQGGSIVDGTFIVEEQMKPWQAEDFVFSDSAYAHHTEELCEHGYLPRICEKGYRNKPLTEKQKAGNREKSKVRCRVEHIFGMTLYFPLRQDRRFKCEWVTKSCDVLVKRGQHFRSGCETSRPDGNKKPLRKRKKIKF